jgi:hypothetical protein
MTSSEDAKRRILQRVADGSLSPTDAANQLAALEADDQAAASGDGAAGTATDAPRPEPVYSSGPSAIANIKVVGTFRAVEIVGDPDVAEAVAEGRHVVARREGDTLVIDGGVSGDDDDDIDDDDWFTFGRRQVRGFAFGGPGGRRRFAHFGASTGGVLHVRMNPQLSLDAKVEAGPLTINDVHGPIRARVAAGPLKINGFESPIDLHVAAGPIKARGVLDHGESRIQCEAGSVNLQLDDDASVQVKATATLGKVNMPGGGGSRRRWDDDERSIHWEDFASGGVGRALGDVLGKLGDTREMTFGTGEGRLEIEVSMGAVNVASA